MEIVNLMSNVIDINKFKETKDVETNNAYLQIIVGESQDEDILVFIEQVETVGSTMHKGQLILDVDMLHSLIEGLYEAAEAIEKGQNK
tara:strand:+ start:670 stop:933 length:264 start_codon:yes stop_codon:yes gene_type:complete